MNITEDVQSLYKLITGAKHCVALTGAGVSTLSGIKDFRGKNGLYNDAEYAENAGKMFDIDYFERDPSLYYRMSRSFLYEAADIAPSLVHNSLAELEAAGYVKAIVTQNIDLLHQKAGAKKVIEVHGSPAVHYCLRCSGVRMSFEEAAAIVKRDELPRCPKCGRALKPAITFFGESLPIKALRDAETETSGADLLLVLGTSLTVYPAAGLPQNTLRGGGKVVLVNNMPTPLDSYCELQFTDLADTFTCLMPLFGKISR
jgi:NAD-dependent deacetylase